MRIDYDNESMKIVLLILIILLPLTAHAFTEYNDVEEIKKIICKKYDELTTVQFDAFFKQILGTLNEVETVTNVNAPVEDEQYPYTDFHTVRIDSDARKVDYIDVKYEYDCKDGKVTFRNNNKIYVYRRIRFGFGTILVIDDVAPNIPKGKIKYKAVLLPSIAEYDVSKYPLTYIIDKYYTIFVIITDFESIE